MESIKELQAIINHFDKYPLITKKLKDYLLFNKAFYLISKKEHLGTPHPRLLSLFPREALLGLHPPPFIVH